MTQTKFWNRPHSWFSVVCMLCINLLWVASAYSYTPPPPSYQPPSVITIIENIAQAVPALQFFTTALAYVLGFWSVYSGLLQLKKLAEARTMGGGDAKMSGPLLYIFVGAALIYLPSSIRSGMSTFWANPNPYQYDTGATDAWSIFVSACFNIIQLIGVIAFIRGLIILSHLGSHGGGQQATAGRAIAHIVGGIFLIDMYDFLQAVFATFGLQMP